MGKLSTAVFWSALVVVLILDVGKFQQMLGSFIQVMDFRDKTDQLAIGKLALPKVLNRLDITSNGRQWYLAIDSSIDQNTQFFFPPQYSNVNTWRSTNMWLDVVGASGLLSNDTVIGW